MSTITLPNIRVSSDLTIRLKLKDGGVAIDWSTLQNIRVSLYADDQRSMASRCNVSIDEEDSTILVCQYAANKMQYLGVNRVIVQCKYMGEVKTYDKPAFNFVRWTSDQEGEQITIDDPDVDVEISVEDVSSSIFQEAVDAAFSAADRANEAAEEAEHMVDIHTGPAGKSPYIGENGHWYEWDEETHQYVDTETNAKGDTGETPDISIGTVTTVEPGTPAAASMTGTPEAPVLNLSIPKGLVGATPNFTVGTVTTGEPGSSVIVTITGTPEAPVLNLTIPQGMQGNTGSSVDYPYELVNNLTTNDATKGLSAAQGYVLDGKVSQLEAKVDGVLVKDITWSNGYINSGGYINSSSLSIFSQPILLKAGQKVTIGTQNTNIAIISKTTADSVAIGNQVTPIKITSNTTQFETYEYTATEDTKIVLCVLASNYTLSFFDFDNNKTHIDEINIEIYGGEIQKELTWSPGYVRSSDAKIYDSSSSLFSQPFLLKRGEKVTIGTNNVRIGIICSTAQNSVAVGDTVTIIEETTTSSFETHTYTAEEDILIVLCVLRSDYTLSFNYEESITKRLDTLEENNQDISEVKEKEDESYFHTSGKFVFSADVHTGEQLLKRHYIYINAGTILTVFCGFSATTNLTQDLRLYLIYADGTNSQAYPISVGKPFSIVADKEMVGVSLYSPVTATGDVTISVDVELTLDETFGNWGYIVPGYYFENGYLSNKAKRISALITEQAATADIFPFTTDEHWEKNAHRSTGLLRYLSSHINMSKCVSGGDSGHLMANIELGRQRREAFGGKIIQAIGNHEYLVAYYHSGDYNEERLDNRLVYAYYMGLDGFIGNIKRGYYYYNDPERKIRYIVLAAYKAGEEQQDGPGNYHISADLGYEQEQLEWLSNEALVVETGWKIIIITHTITGYIHDSEDRLVPTISGFNTVCETLLRYNGEGEIMCIFAGHTHRDGIILINDEFVGISENKTGKTLPVIVSTCDAYDFSEIPSEVLEGRTYGTITEQAFDVVLADYSKKEIRSVRIGAPACLDFAKIGTLEERVINYEYKSVSVGSSIQLSPGLSGVITWDSQDDSAATVNSSGMVTGVSEGSVFVTAIDTTNKISSTFIIKVN